MSEMNTQEPHQAHTLLPTTASDGSPQHPSLDEGAKEASEHDSQIQQASADILWELSIHTGQTEAENRLRSLGAQKIVLHTEKLMKLAAEEKLRQSPIDRMLPPPDHRTLPLHQLVAEHDGELTSTVADPRFDEAASTVLQRENFRLFDEDDNPIVTDDEIMSFVRAQVSGQAEALARSRDSARAFGAAKAAEFTQVMRFGVEGNSQDDNARRLQAAQAVQAVVLRDGWDASTREPFALTSVIKHGGNLSEVVNDPGLHEDVCDHMYIRAVEPDVDVYLAQGVNREYFDSVIASLKLKEQYGTDNSLQKATEAASFAASQQRFPISHAASGEGRTTGQARATTTNQQPQKGQTQSRAR